jgi:thiol-disulfide isomerase/thioredoxin
VHGEIAALTLALRPQPLPELSFSGPEGASASLADFKGRTILFNLWATWCVPCRQEMPALDRLQGLLGSKDFAVVAVNIDTARLDRPKAFLEEIGVKNLSFYADSSAAVLQALKREGRVLGLPTTILVGKDGCEIGTLAGPAQWDSQDALALLKAVQE